MTASELRALLDALVRRHRPDLAWHRSIAVRDDGAHPPELRRTAKHLLQHLATEHLPGSFWTETNRAAAARVGVEIPAAKARTGRVDFPVVVDGRDHDFFASVVATVVLTPGERDARIGESAWASIREAEAEARRITGDQRPLHFRIEAPQDVPMIDGPSCGLAAALAALSAFGDIPIDDTLVATGRIRYESVYDVSDLPKKLRLRREARPLARMLVPSAAAEKDDRAVPVPTLRAARDAAVHPDQNARDVAVEQYQAQLSQDSLLRRVNLQALHGIRKGPHSTQLDILDLVVPPHFDGEEHEAWWQQWLAEILAHDRRPDLDASDRRAVDKAYRSAEAHRFSEWRGNDGRGWPLAALLRVPRLAIIAEAGMGKSTVLRLVALACMEGADGARARSLIAEWNWRSDVEFLRGYLPIQLSFAYLAQMIAAEHSIGVADVVRRRLQEQAACLALICAVDDRLDQGGCLLLVDGVDEAPEDQRDAAVRALDSFVAEHPKARLVVTSRPYGYHPRIADLAHVHIRSFDRDRKRRLLERMLLATARLRGDTATAVEARARASSLLDSASNDPKLHELTTNPLLLGLLALSPTVDGTAPHRVELYENFVRTLIDSWSRTRRTSTNRRGSPTADRFLAAWSTVAAVTVREEQRHGLSRARVLRILAQALDVSNPEDESVRMVLEQGLDDGIVRDVGSAVIAFMHSSFAEFLAALTLTRPIAGAGERLLREASSAKLNTLVLQLAAGRLSVVEEAHEEVATLINGLIAKDRSHHPSFETPGLRLASSILADRVPVARATWESVLTAWINKLEKWPASLLSSELAFVLKAADEVRLPRPLLERLIALHPGQSDELREQIVRVAVAQAPNSKEAVELFNRVLGTSTFLSRTSAREHDLAARGLARAGQWSDAVVTQLSEYARHEDPPFRNTRALVEELPQERWERLEEEAAEGAALLQQQGEGAKPGVRTLGQTSLSENAVRAATLVALRAKVPAAAVDMLVACVATSHGHWKDSAKKILPYVVNYSAALNRLCELLLDERYSSNLLKEVLVDIALQREDVLERIVGSLARLPASASQEIRESFQVLLREQPATEPLLRAQLASLDVGACSMAAFVLFNQMPNDEAVVAALRRGCQSWDERWRLFCAETVLVSDRKDLPAVLLTTAAAAVLAHVPQEKDRDRWFRSRHGWYSDQHRAALLACLLDEALPGIVRVKAATKLRSRHHLNAPEIAPLRALLSDEDTEVRGRAAVELARRGTLDADVAGELVFVIERKREFDDYLFDREVRVAPEHLVSIAERIRERAARVDSTTAKLDGFRWTEFSVQTVTAAAHESPAFFDLVLETFESATPDRRLARAVMNKLREKPEALARMAAAAGRFDIPAALQWRYARFFFWSAPYPEILVRLLVTVGASASGVSDEDRYGAAEMLCRLGHRTEAIEIWRNLLKGDWALDAAEDLVIHDGSEAHTTTVEPLRRMLLDAATARWRPGRRLRLANLALRLDMERELAVRLVATVLRDPDEEHFFLPKLDNPGPIYFVSDRKEGERPALPPVEVNLGDLLFRTTGAHKEALQLLLEYSPNDAVPILVEWLTAKDGWQFGVSVRCLLYLKVEEKAVRDALLGRLRGDHHEEWRGALNLIESMGCINRKLIEEVVAFWDRDPEHHRYWTNASLARMAARTPEVLQVVLSLRPMTDEETIHMLSDLLGRLGLVHDEAIELGLDLALNHDQRWAFEKVFKDSTDEDAKVQGEDDEPIYIGCEEPVDKRRERLAEIEARRMRWKAFCASVRMKTRAAFRARWQPVDAEATLEADEIAAAIGMDTQERVEKLWSVLRSDDGHYAFIAAKLLAALGAFNADVEAVLWKRVEAAVTGARHGGLRPDGTWDGGWQLYYRFEAADILIAHVGTSERLKAALFRLADTPGFGLREQKELLSKLRAAGLDDTAASEWLASRIADTPPGELARDGLQLIEGATLPIIVAARVLLVIMAAGDHGEASQAARFLEHCLDAPDTEEAGDSAQRRLPHLRTVLSMLNGEGAPKIGEQQRPRRYAWSWDPDHPALRRGFFRRAHEQALPSWLEDLVWELAGVAPELLQDYRVAVKGGLSDADRWGALEGSLQQRRPEPGGAEDATELRIANFAREWLVHRLAKDQGEHA